MPVFYACEKKAQEAPVPGSRKGPSRSFLKNLIELYLPQARVRSGQQPGYTAFEAQLYDDIDRKGMNHLYRSDVKSEDKTAQVVTLSDLYDELVGDPTLSYFARRNLKAKLDSESQTRGLTKNSIVTSSMGGIIGYLIAKLLKRGPFGKAVGLGLGAMAGRTFGRRGPDETGPQMV